MREGLDFVRGHKLLVTMAACVGIWQMCSQGAMVVQILFAIHELGLSERGVGLSYVALGVGTVFASANGHRVVRRLGPGPTLVLGFAISGTGWLLLAVGTCQLLRSRCLRGDAVDVRRRRDLHIHQFPIAATVGDARTDARAHDEHDALVDPACPPDPARCSAAGWANISDCVPPWGFPASRHCCWRASHGGCR